MGQSSKGPGIKKQKELKNDIARAQGYQNHNDAVKRIKQSEKPREAVGEVRGYPVDCNKCPIWRHCYDDTKQRNICSKDLDGSEHCPLVELVDNRPLKENW